MRPIILLILLILPGAVGQMRSPVVSSIDQPRSARKTDDGRWFIDFGKAAFGNVEITAPSNAAPATLTVHLAEARADRTSVNPTPGGTVRYQQHSLSLVPNQPRSPDLTWSPPGWMRSGWVHRPEGMPEVMPFRYVEIEGAPEGFSADWIRRVSWSVPFDPDASSFRCSSPELNDVWELCKYSVKATSFLGLYVDGDRERKPYEADALINQLSHYCVDQRYDTARFTHEYLLQHPTWPTEWRLQSVMLAWLDFLWSGDDASLREYYPTLKERALLERRRPDGLLQGFHSRSQSPGLEDIIDWPAGERDDYDMTVGVKTVVTAWHYQSLVLLEKMARHLGQTVDADQFAAQAARTRSTVNAQLWDANHGCYLDGLHPETGAISAHASAHANFFPLAFGMVPAERVPRVVTFLKSRGMACSVYGAQFLLDALYEADEGAYALSLMTSDELRSWRNMIEQVGSTITLEAWDASLKPNLDWNHAWGAAPANLIPRGLMGVDPIEPGFRRFRVRPHTGSLTEASLRMPSPNGTISLSIRQPSDRAWTARIDVPKGSTAEFHLPPHQPSSLELTSGKPRIKGAEKGRSIIELRSGTHEIHLTPTP